MHTPPKKRLCPTVIIIEDLPDDAVVVGVTEDIGLGGDILTCRLLVGKVEATTTVDVIAERSKVWIIHICPTRRETLGIATATLRETSIADDTAVRKHLAFGRLDSLTQRRRLYIGYTLITLAMVVGTDMKQAVSVALVPTYVDGIVRVRIIDAARWSGDIL